MWLECACSLTAISSGPSIQMDKVIINLPREEALSDNLFQFTFEHHFMKFLLACIGNKVLKLSIFLTSVYAFYVNHWLSQVLNQHGMLAEFSCSHSMITLPIICCEVVIQLSTKEEYFVLGFFGSYTCFSMNIFKESPKAVPF